MSLREAVAAGRLDRYLVEVSEEAQRRAIVEQHGGAVRESLAFYDPYRTKSVGDLSAEEQLALEDRGWITLGTGGSGLLSEVITDHERIWQRLAALYFRDPVARNIVNNYTHFTIGRGFAVTFPSDRQQREFDEWARLARFWSYLRRMVRTTYLFGECFTQRFPSLKISAEAVADVVNPKAETNGDATVEVGVVPAAPTLARAFRLFEPRRFSDIVTHPEDFETVVAYRRDSSHGTEYVHPEHVIHHRSENPGSIVRGTSILIPAIVDLMRLEKLRENRYFINYARGRVPLVFEVEGGAQAVTAAKAALDLEIGLPPPARTWVMNKAGRWSFPAHNINASDVRDDWRLLVLSIAAAVSLPEYLVLQDASNANYSSTLVAESPAHHMFMALQEVFIEDARRLISWFFPGREFEVEPAPIVPRDFNAEATGWGVLLDRGVVSAETVQAAMGLDPAEEREKLERERQDKIMNSAAARAMLGQPMPEEEDEDGDDDGAGDGETSQPKALEPPRR